MATIELAGLPVAENVAGSPMQQIANALGVPLKDVYARVDRAWTMLGMVENSGLDGEAMAKALWRYSKTPPGVICDFVAAFNKLETDACKHVESGRILAHSVKSCKIVANPVKSATLSSTEGLTKLGSEGTSYAYQGADAKLLERFANPMKRSTRAVPRDSATKLATIEITAPEFTSLCPMTGQPDFATIVVEYEPRDWCVESKAFKLYLGSFRQTGEFHEACVERIANDLRSLLAPRWLKVVGQFTPRGGIKFWPTVEYTEAPDSDVTFVQVSDRVAPKAKGAAEGMPAEYADGAPARANEAAAPSAASASETAPTVNVVNVSNSADGPRTVSAGNPYHYPDGSMRFAASDVERLRDCFRALRAVAEDSRPTLEDMEHIREVVREASFVPLPGGKTRQRGDTFNEMMRKIGQYRNVAAGIGLAERLRRAAARASISGGDEQIAAGFADLARQLDGVDVPTTGYAYSRVLDMLEGPGYRPSSEA